MVLTIRVNNVLAQCTSLQSNVIDRYIELGGSCRQFFKKIYSRSINGKIRRIMLFALEGQVSSRFRS